MAYREIPSGAVEIQTGLYLYEYQRVISGTTYTFRQLYSSEGYCFYDSTDEFRDQEGNLIPSDEILPTQRMYYQFMQIPLSKNLNDFVSVLVEEGFQIVN